MTDIAARLRAEMWPLCDDAADEIERLRELCQGLGRIQHANEETCGKAADKIERLKVDCDRLREFNTRLCAEIEKLRGMIREAMSELLIAQEDNQMSSASYRGEWLGELIGLCQRGLENREASR